MTPLRIVIAGGGTGGHLYPGIAVARELLRRRPDSVITFAGTSRGIEARVIPREGFELDVLRSAGLKGTSPRALVTGLSLLPLSGVDAWRILSRRRPRPGHRCRRIQLGTGRGARRVAPHPNVAARAERSARVHEPHALACGERGGRDV